MNGLKIGIHQPQYLAWPGYFAKILCADIFILYDTAQYQKNSLINRNAVLANHQEHFLTIPTLGGSLHDRITDKRTANDIWKAKHAKTLEANYRKCPFFKQAEMIMKNTLACSTDSLCEINCANVRCICAYLGIPTRVLLSSTLEIETEKDATQKLVDMVKKVSGTQYISGTGSKNYLKEELFAIAGIGLKHFRYVPGDYPQTGEPRHVSGLSIIDMIANLPKEEILLRLEEGWTEEIQNQG